ncbi:hypothetical protein GCM10027346_12350 [Hymenobacter seoulensis]
MIVQVGKSLLTRIRKRERELAAADFAPEALLEQGAYVHFVVNNQYFYHELRLPKQTMREVNMKDGKKQQLAV